MMTWSSVEKKILVCLFGTTVLSACAVATVASFPPSRNAALVHYQACLLASDLTWPDGFFQASIFETRFDPGPPVKSFVNSQDLKEVIDLITVASRMPQCDWGLAHMWPLTVDRQVAGPVRNLGRFLIVQGRVFACDGRYTAALENALTARRVARQLGADTFVMWGCSQSVDTEAFALIRYVLGKMPPDTETLTWLEKELAAAGDLRWHPRETLARWRDWVLECLQASPELAAKVVEDSVSQEEQRNLTVAQVLDRARVTYNRFLESALEILESERPSQGKYDDLEQLLEKFEFNAADGAPTIILSDLISDTRNLFLNDIYCRAQVQAVRAAMAIYRAKAASGKLPETLPADLPKDPYSGKDLEYQVTDKGFVLRCRAETLRQSPSRPKIRQYEFPVVE
jgi:hypothetical protein